MTEFSPDSHHLNNYGSVDFNEELLKHPATIETNSFLREAACEDPGLSMLSPLSRLLFYRNRLETPDCLDECLDSTYIVVGEDRDERPTRESVYFEINKLIEGNRYSLRFRSEASLIWAGEDINEENPFHVVLSFPLLSVAGKFSQLAAITMKDLSGFLDHEIDLRLPEREADGSPVGYITDDGEFVCSIEHRLVSINGTPLDPAPQIYDSVHESCIQSADPGSTFEHINRRDQFSWIDLLSSETRSKLGLAKIRAEDSASHALEPHQQYLSAQELEWHYQQGKLDSANSSTARIVSIQLGAGSSWDPEWSQEDRHDEDSEEFPEDCPPSHELRISTAKPISGQDRILLHILELLAEAIRNNA